MTARKGPKNHLDSIDVLEAVSVLGIRWTVAFTDEEIVTVNEALDRELLNGNLSNAFTVSPQGRELLRASSTPRSEAHIDLHVDTTCSQCRLGADCWVVRCTRCDTLEVRHVHEPVLLVTVRAALRSHACPGGSPPGPVTVAVTSGAPGGGAVRSA